jgi:hypothetical protein
MVGEASISVLCACGKKLKASASAIGRKARCPACGNTVTLKVPSAAVPPPLPPVIARPSAKKVVIPADDDGLGALYELAEQAHAAPIATESPRCPSCRSEMERDAVLCMGCGYDVRTGKSITTSPAKKQSLLPAALAAKPKNKPVDLMAPEGSLLLGVAMCAAFAFVASLLWIAVAWVTGFSIGYIAILIGGAAGVGMRVGHKGFSKTGGMIAAAMTLAAILCAKLVVMQLELTHLGLNISVFDMDSAALCTYLFKPIGLIIIAIGMGAAFRTANGSVSD